MIGLLLATCSTQLGAPPWGRGGTFFTLTNSAGDGSIRVEISDANIELTFSGTWSFNTTDPKTFEGVVITDDEVNITSVSLNRNSSIRYPQSNISLDSHTIALNFPSPPFGVLGGDETVAVDVTTSSIPEPSSWAMMLIGFAGLGFAGYRAKRKGRGLNGVSRAH
jgi:PEP-CTERM motif